MRPTPHTHFKDLAAAFVYYTECNFATLDRLGSRRTAKCHLTRQKNICDDMISTVIQLVPTERLREILNIGEAMGHTMYRRTRGEILDREGMLKKLLLPGIMNPLGGD